ncbi:HAD family hydrolase [Treponema primitia]|uniref:HAD family hydrolase n=1 Tax=Treponema primitia TaxID=88058 RepID=UPI0002555303|nr:HAD family phosphatase [Treponema primitia]
MVKEEPLIPRAVIFDMDGLMLDTERPAIVMWTKAAKELGWELPEEIGLKTIGRDEESTRQIIVDFCSPGFPYEKTRELMRDLIFNQGEKEGIPHRPGLLVLLNHLSRLKLPLGVATSTPREIARWKLEKAGILERFSVMACGDEVERGKPAPDIFLLAAKRLDQAPQNCIGFEDSPAGLTALHAAGIPSVFVKDLVEPPEEVLRWVWRRCGDLAEAAELFGP